MENKILLQFGMLNCENLHRASTKVFLDQRDVAKLLS